MSAVKRFEETLRASRERHFAPNGKPISYETIKKRDSNKEAKIIEASIVFTKKKKISNDVLNSIDTKLKVKTHRVRNIVISVFIAGVFFITLVILRAYLVDLESKIDRSDESLITKNDMIVAIDERIKEKEDLDYLKKVAKQKKLSKYKKRIKVE